MDGTEDALIALLRGSRSRRLAATSAVLLAVLAGSTPRAVAVPVPGPGTAGGFHTGVRGVGADGTAPAADLAAGFDLRVDPSAPHATRIGAAMSYAAAQARRYGIDVRYRGIAVKPEDSPAYGQLTVRESTDPNSSTCTSRTSAENGLIVDASTVPSFQDVGIASRVNAAEITFCPPMWVSDQDYVESIALHELGHAVGLGHYAGTFAGGVQIMNPAVPDLQEYQPGDINGLRYLAAQTLAVQRASTVRGQVESWQATSGGLDVAGWAIVGTTYQFANIDVTRDGTTIYAITTGGSRPDISARFGARWPNSGFHGSQIAMPPGLHRYCVEAAVPTAPDDRTVLGCRDLRPPSPATSPAPTTAKPAVTASQPVRHARDWATWVVIAGSALSAGLVAFALVRVRRRRR